MFRKGEYHRLGMMYARVLRHDRGGGRYMIVTPRRLGNAVCRNRVRRWVREALRCHVEARGAAEGCGGWDVSLFFGGKTQADLLSYEGLRQEVDVLMQHLTEQQKKQSQHIVQR